MDKFYIKITFFLLGVLLISEVGLSNTDPEIKEGKTQNTTAAMSSCIGANGTVPWYIYRNIPNSTLEILYHQPNFPQSPDVIKYISELATSSRYDNNFGSFIRGFIRAPETGAYTFNLTADDESMFFLSTDTIASDTVMACWVPSWTGETEFDKFSEQTSVTFNLVQDEYYYFEVHQKDGGGGDHLRVHWQTPSTTSWQVIHGSHLYQYDCGFECDPKGTPCNDGNANTVNDQEDGHCNCQGIPTILPFSCIGEVGELTSLYYDTLSGSDVVNLTSAAKYPLMPDRSERIDRLDGPLVAGQQYGSRVRGYIRVPVSGQYLFNLTGDNETIFMLSGFEVPNAGSEICHNMWATDDYDHYNHPEQTSDSIYLQAGTFYSIELLHKESWGGDHFTVFWQTPFAQDSLWRIVDGSYLFEYSCDLACIPQGTPCNDNDPNTFDDQYDANCNCVGTHCIDPQCSNALGYSPYDECASTDKHSNNPSDSWLSCMPTQSPNPARGMSHWIQYDFGQVYQLDNAQIWNYNVDGVTNQGFQNVVIDYSLDGTNWNTLGFYTWGEASGGTDYSGFSMSEFSGINAQYVLITSLDNFAGTNCMGISEISFSAYACPGPGSPCDDGDPLTGNDVYDNNCNCNGIPNSCPVSDLTINDPIISGGNYEVEFNITADGTIETATSVNFIAGAGIELLPGFEADTGSIFLGVIIPCGSISNLVSGDSTTTIPDVNANQLLTSKALLTLHPNPTDSWTKFNFTIPNDGEIELGVYDSAGKLVQKLMNNEFMEKGVYTKDFPAHRLAAGMYYVTLRTGETVLTERLVVVDIR